MSRAHMVYDDKAISKVINVRWKGKWEEANVFRFVQKPGGIIEGTVKERGRLVVNVDEHGHSGGRHHYNVVQIEFKKGFKRTFDGAGREIEPWKASTKKVNTGHLMSSYKTVEVDTSVLNLQEIAEIVKLSELDAFLPNSFKSPGTVALFYCETSFANVELNIGDYVRTKTKGNGPYIEYLAKVDQGHVSSSNYESGATGQGSWTDKIMSMKGKQTDDEEKQDEVDENEWDD